MGFVGIAATCHHCKQDFPSKTKLHRHLRDGCQIPACYIGDPPSLVDEALDAETQLPMVELTADRSELGSGYGFRY